MMMMMSHNSSSGGGEGVMPCPAPPCHAPAQAAPPSSPLPVLTNVNARDTKNMYTVPLTPPPRGARTPRGTGRRRGTQSCLSPAAATLHHWGLGAGLLVAQGIGDTTLTLLDRYTLQGNTRHIRTLLGTHSYITETINHFILASSTTESGGA